MGEEQEMPISTVAAVFERLKRQGVGRVCLAGGEPFLRIDLARILHLAKLAGFSTTVTTNGTLVDRYQDTALIRSIDMVEISFDSLEVSYLESVNRHAEPSSVAQSIAHFIHHGIPAQVLTVVTSRNLSEVPRIIDWCHNNGVKQLKLQPVYLPSGHQYAEDLSLGPEETKRLCDIALAAYEEDPRISEYFAYVARCATRGSIAHICNAFRQFVYVDVEGGFRRCPTIKDEMRGTLFEDAARECSSMSLDCLYTYNLIEDFTYRLKP